MVKWNQNESFFRRREKLNKQVDRCACDDDKKKSFFFVTIKKLIDLWCARHEGEIITNEFDFIFIRRS